MSDINTVSLTGRLTKDMELKYTNTGTAIGKFSLAVNRSVKSGDEWKEEASFFDCTMWGKRAEALTQYMVRGKQIAITGELRQNRWESEGQKRSKVEINITDIVIVKSEIANKKQAPAESPEAFEDDIPF